MTITSHFRPLQVGPYVLTNRLVMAPMTRSRATEDGVPTALMSLYYEQELNLKEIGAVLGVTESRVCQLHGQALARLRARLADWR